MAGISNVWFRGSAKGVWVEIRTSKPDMTVRQLRHLQRIIAMMIDWCQEDELRAGPEDSCVGRDEDP